MTDVLAVALALGLGFVLGLGVGAVRALRVEARRRAAAGVSAQMARLWPTELPERSAADIIAGIIRVVLGGRVYELPVLPRAPSRRWLESLDVGWADALSDVSESGNDQGAILARLMAYHDELYALLKSYDTGNVLPPIEDIDEYATDAEIFRAVVEVWRAANPLAATLAGMASPTDGTSPAASSSSPLPMAGVPTTSTST